LKLPTALRYEAEKLSAQVIPVKKKPADIGLPFIHKDHSKLEADIK